MPGGAIDVVRFRKHLDVGEVEAALAEWTGAPLAGLDAPGLAATVDGLLEERLAALETALGRQVDADPAAVIGALTELTVDHPFREGFWALLMTALYRLGRQADALAAFQRVRYHLVDELGVEPGRRLRDLEARILDQSPSLGDPQGSQPVRGDGTRQETFRRGASG
ncbi:AfsR/SARP family transcriptional regulator [Cellulomonas sp. ATA003]|uniref:AfsR/SARP family transcriptional regulator n=1 Tax=Cellulomonas sp. ATA003 TaxID=3073064 RepID=UPI0028738053|nr:AfsR/SARP family transcriptional regulator [Cellulomonas sp. ATA003]WNB85857.1 AfsR/SARP family transcriptional regulator [Cellulomonas sp. ATA003]